MNISDRVLERLADHLAASAPRPYRLKDEQASTKVLAAVAAYSRVIGHAPRQRDLQAPLGMSKNNLYSTVLRLKNCGMVIAYEDSHGLALTQAGLRHLRRLGAKL